MNQSLPRRRAAISVALFVLLASLYLLTYSGYPESGDSLQLADALTSALTYGDLRLDQSAWAFAPQPSELNVNDPLPLERVITEPMQMIAAAPLVLAARALPEIGIMHAAWLLNVLVCAGIGVVFFWTALSLGYPERAGIAGALALGLATAIWPYSRSFFREPLLALWLLLAVLCLVRLREARSHSVWYAAWAIFAIIAALLTKASAALVIPALLVLAMPQRARGRTVALVALGLGALALGFLLLSALDTGFSQRYDVLSRILRVDTQNVYTALAAWAVSPGGSLWGTSPSVLLAIPGLALLWRAGQRRFPLFLLVLLVTFVIGYAVLNAAYWFGGLSWPPRFLVPLLPMLMLGTLPVWARLLRRPVSWWWLPVGALIAYSVFIQITGATLDWTRYAELLPAESGGLLDWQSGLYDPSWFRWVRLPALWVRGEFDSAWQLADLGWMTLALTVLAASSAAGLVWWLCRPVARHALWLAMGLFLAFAILTVLGLRALYATDERYRAWDAPLFAMLPLLEQQTSATDLILLDGPDLAPFFMNYDKRSGGGRVVSLPFQPGEQPSPEQPPLVESSNPDDGVAFETRPLLAHLASQYDRLWLLVNGGPDLWYSRRPVERYLNAYRYPVQTVATGPITRLIEYDTTAAPAPHAFFNADLPAGLEFGEALTLQGVHLPSGAAVRAGDVLPISLHWRSRQPVDANYTVVVFLRGEDGSPVTQSDAQPDGGFTPTSGWSPGQLVWDHRGLRVPVGTPPGDYQLWVKVYDFGPDGAPRDLTVTQGESLDPVVGVLPVAVRVQ